MNHFNQIFVAGKLTLDPEVKQQGDLTICIFPIEITENYKKKSGEMKTTITKVIIEAFGGLAEHCAGYLQVGMPCMVQGRLRYESYQDNEGVTKSRHLIQADNVLFLGEVEPAVAPAKPQAVPQGYGYKKPEPIKSYSTQKAPYKSNQY